MVTFDAFRLGLAAAFTAALNFILHHVFMSLMQMRATEGMGFGDVINGEVLKVVIMSTIEGFVLGYLFALVYNHISKK